MLDAGDRAVSEMYVVIGDGREPVLRHDQWRPVVLWTVTFRTMPGEHLCGGSKHGCRIRPSEPSSSARLGTAPSRLECPMFRRLLKSAKGNGGDADATPASGPVASSDNLHKREAVNVTVSPATCYPADGAGEDQLASNR